VLLLIHFLLWGFCFGDFSLKGLIKGTVLLSTLVLRYGLQQKCRTWCSHRRGEMSYLFVVGAHR